MGATGAERRTDMDCYRNGEDGCQGGASRTVDSLACCWPCGSALLRARDPGDEHRERRQYRGAGPLPESGASLADAGPIVAEGGPFTLVPMGERLERQRETIDALRADLAKVTAERDGLL